MESVILSEEEILCIQSFIKEASDIPMVECVYLVSFLDNNTKHEHIDVIAIQNQSLYYNGKLIGKETMRNIDNELNNLEKTIKKYRKQFENGRLSFVSEDDSNYSLALMAHREIRAEMSLTSGIILFDRFGDKEENKQQASQMLPIYPNILHIENIEQIMNNYKKTTVLKKIKK